MEDANQNISSTFRVGIQCPVCKTFKTKVMDSRSKQNIVRRRRICENNHKFSTLETYATIDSTGKLTLDKSTFTEEDFKEQGIKLRNALISSIDYRAFVKNFHNI